MKQFGVTGMSCSACSSHVEKAVRSVEGVKECTVNLLTNSMKVDGTASDKDIIDAVVKAGYGAFVQETLTLNDPKLQEDIRRLMVSAGLLLGLLYCSVGHRMLRFPLPWNIGKRPLAEAILEMFFSGMILWTQRRFFADGFRGVIHNTPNMETLISMGAGISFLWSVYVTARIGLVQNYAEPETLAYWRSYLSFTSAGMILTLISVGKLLETISKGKTTNALKGLVSMTPKTAVVRREGQEVTVSVAHVKIDELFLVRPGEAIPVDGSIEEGNAAIDEAMLTGESIPVDKGPGDEVFAGTINTSGFLCCRAEHVGEDTSLAKITRMVSDAVATKAPIARMADRVAGYFVPTVIIISFLTFVIWLFIGADVGSALTRAISVLVISCPCSLGLATPVAIMVGSGVGAKNGVLFKTAADLEKAGRISNVILDKTGTLTEGKPVVTDVLTAEGVEEAELLRAACLLEQRSIHPLAGAVLRYSVDRYGVNIIDTQSEVTNFLELPGKGLFGKVEDCNYYCGTEEFVGVRATIPKELLQKVKKLSREGKTPLFFAKDRFVLGIMAAGDVLRPGSEAAVEELNRMDIKVSLLTGDNKETAEAIAAQAGITEIVAEVLPEGKKSIVENYKANGKTAMVGDGINDAPALSAADLGIAVGRGTDVALDAADIILMKSSPEDIVTALQLGRATLWVIRENLFWAFFYNVIGIPIAAGVLTPFGIELSPMFGALAMSLSSFLVVTNALRLNFFKKYETPKEEKSLSENTTNTRQQETENLPETEERQEMTKNTEAEYMEKTLKITGMMCPKCEAHVKKALEAIDGVVSATPDHTNNCAIVVLSKEVPEEVLRQAVTEAGYTPE